MKTAAAIAALLLAACSTTPPATTTVSKAVYVPCDVPVPAKPTFPADTLTGDEDVFTLGTVLWADRLARKAYELKVEIALAACVKK